MAIENNKTSAIIEEQIPAFIREDHDNFVQFLKSYYEFLELTAPPTKIPLIIKNPLPDYYMGDNTYGGKFQVGETIQQKANPDNPTEVTATAKVFSWSGNTTAQTAIVTSFGGTKKVFEKDIEVVGEKSGVKFYPSVKTESLRAGAGRASLDLRKTKDIDETLDDYVQYIKDEFALNLPRTFHPGTDTRTVLKNIRDFYKARGTENSFKFLFRLLYGEDISIYIPETDMLRASDANWKNASLLRTEIPLLDEMTNIPVETSDFVGRKIKGVNSKASAIVEKAQEIIYGGFRFTELEISNKLGTFSVNENIQTDNVGDGTVIKVKVLGVLANINIVDPGSNYKVGDEIVISPASGDAGKSSGAIARVATVNSSSGAIASVNVIDPGYDYTKVPTVDATGPHNADAGATRFEAGPLETIYYNDFSQYTDANSFFAESDNRGPRSNVGPSTNHPYGDNAYSNDKGVINPALVTANSIGNFVTIPGVDEGLKGYWKMNSYYPKDVTINTADATANDGHDPIANNTFKGPRVGDITFIADPLYNYSMQQTQLNYINYSYTNSISFPDRTGANTYSSSGWYGFQPVVYDESGHGHHAYLTVWRAGDDTTSTINVYSEIAFANAGIFGAGSGNSLGTFGEGGIVLMPHDDIRNANTQSWVFWYNPLVHDTTAATAAYTSQRRIITRDKSMFWSISANGGYSDLGTGTSERDDILFHFSGEAKFDNGALVTEAKLANSSGYFPGGPGQINDAAGVGGILKLNTWNMIALTIDYNDQGSGKGVGNVYIFNTDDGLVVANGFSIPVTQDANTTHSYGWAEESYLGVTLVQGRAVVLGENCESANGDTFAAEDAVNSEGQYDEVRYYDKALTWNQIEHLFYNPGGRFDKVLSGDWKALNQNTNFYSDSTSTGPTRIEFPSSKVISTGTKYLSVGDAAGAPDGLQIVHTKNIPFDSTIRYKMSANAKDASASTGSNTAIGIIGFSNTGIEVIGNSGVDHWDNMYGIVQSAGGIPAESGSLSDNWATYTAVYGGNTTHIGTHSSTDSAGHGGNSTQATAGPAGKQEFEWANPVRLFGHTTAAVQQGTGNTTFVRPILFFNSLNQNDSTLIDHIKIEQQKDATLIAEIGAEFKYPGEYIDDSGKIGTSPVNAWLPKFIQDDIYYQIYSYVIKSGLSIGTYKEVVKKLVHPAGLIMFSRVDIQSMASVKMAGFSETFSGELIDLLRTYYMGAESSQLEDYANVPLAGRGVGYKTKFGIKEIARGSFNLDLAHGVNPHGAGHNTPGSPGWIAWDQSPLTSPYANSHYYANSSTSLNLWPYDGLDSAGTPYATSNAYTTVSSDTMIWHIKGFRTILGSAFQNANVGSLWAHSFAEGYDDINGGRRQHGWSYFCDEGTQFTTRANYGVTAPLGIDGKVYRYVRMKVRRIGPGGYGTNSWLGVCQADTIPSSRGAEYSPTLGLTPTEWKAGTNPTGTEVMEGGRTKFYGSANTLQPSTLIISSDALVDTKSPWHILEWDMHSLGAMDIDPDGTSEIIPENGRAEMWKDANESTGSSLHDGGTGRRIGTMSFQLCYEPDNKPTGEKFEIEWIQVDDGTGWPRGSYPTPTGYIANNIAVGSGTGGLYQRLRVSESSDMSNQTIGDFSAIVSPAVASPSEIGRGAPILYVHSEKKVFGSDIDDLHFDANGAIFRVSANTANNLDWIVTEIIDSEKFLLNAPLQDSTAAYVGGSLSANGKFSGPVILDTDPNDNLYVGYVYEYDSDPATYPGLTAHTDQKPLMLFRLTPTDNVQASMTELADPHNLRSTGSEAGSWFGARGRSNTYSVEQILWGNVGGVDGIGVMVGGTNLYGEPGDGGDELELSGVGDLIDFSTDALGSLYIVGSGSQNIIKILPAANGSYANGLSRLTVPNYGFLPGRSVFELATPETIDANGDVLGNWRPQHIIHGPRDSLFVACDTGWGSNTYTETYRADFSSSDDDWVSFGSFGTITTQANSIRVTKTTAGWPGPPTVAPLYISDANFTNISGADYPYVTVRIKAVDVPAEDTAWVGGLSWKTLNEVLHEQVYLGSTGVSLNLEDIDSDFWPTVSADADGFKTLTWDLTGISAWTDNEIQEINYLVTWQDSDTQIFDIDSIVIHSSLNFPGPTDDSARGANSVYCYHVVTDQNIATGEFYTKGVYPVYANTRSREYHATLGSGTRNALGLQHTCAGMVLDNEDPPNLYYMTANTMYRIKPKGYSYQIGDTEIEQVFPERYFEDTLNVDDQYVGILGRYRTLSMTSDFGWESNFSRLQIDSRNRIYFQQKSNLFCYSRGSNTTFLVNEPPIVYNQSNTEFSTLQVVANTAMYTSNIDWNFAWTGSSTGTESIDDFVLGPPGANSSYWVADSFNGGVYFTAHAEDGSTSTSRHPRMLCAVYPNTNGSFITADGGQLALTIMDDNPSAQTKFWTDGTGGSNKYRGTGPAKVVLRPEKV